MTINQRVKRQRVRALKKAALETAILTAIAFAFTWMFWEGLHRQLDLQDAQNQRWAQEAQL